MHTRFESERDLLAKNLQEFKELLVLILEQDNSQYFQQRISELKKFTILDKSQKISFDSGSFSDSHQASDQALSAQMKNLFSAVQTWSNDFEKIQVSLAETVQSTGEI